MPIDPEWKQDYAASVRRLIRDGVDVPLANLFVHAARALPPDAEGAARARSATEAFLYRRLRNPAGDGGAIPHSTRSCRSRLNAGRDGSGSALRGARLAIELDGAQHLADADAYRRDRRKDAVLQENGYFVLRFLAEDVGKHLDDVLDAIERAVAHQREVVRG